MDDTFTIDSLANRTSGIATAFINMTKSGNRLAVLNSDEGENIPDTSSFYTVYKRDAGEWVREFDLTYDTGNPILQGGTSLQFDCSGRRLGTSDVNGIQYIYDLELLTSAEDIDQEQDLLLYPNPHRKTFYLKRDLLINESIAVIDLNGRQVSIKGNNIEGYELIGGPGLYTIRISDGNTYSCLLYTSPSPRDS